MTDIKHGENGYGDEADAGFDETAYYPETATQLTPADRLTPRLPLPLFASGLYQWSQRLLVPDLPVRPIPTPLPIHPDLPIPPRPGPGPSPTGLEAEAATDEALLPILFNREELRLDVDGRYPQMTASGTLFRRFTMRTHWIASLTRTGSNSYTGAIWFKDGDTAGFPFTNVNITVIRSLFPNQRRVTIQFAGGGATRTRTYGFVSSYFHKVEFEFDHQVGATPVLDINTTAHPNRPASLGAETLTATKVFQRAGFDVRVNGAVSAIPSDGADANTTWSDAEMHDAMQVYWSRFADRSQWAMWVLTARQHDMGSGLGGIMFDSIGPNHRQGTALFTDSFINVAPGGDPAPDAWKRRMQFWTMIHEMGHAFNLAHSWQKNLGTPWIPLAADGEARSFMNYPFRVAGGQQAFFADFQFRFSNPEMLFMRHAPSRFVEMGNADWFDHHGFEQPDGAGELELELRIDRDKPHYDFMEPVVVELRITNRATEPRIVPESLLADAQEMLVITKRDGQAARQWRPFAHHCREPRGRVLQPGDSLTESLFVAVGEGGWHIDEPGNYTLQVALEANGQELMSNPLRIRVAPPRSFEEQHLAQDVFTEDAGRVMAFDGSMVLESGIDAWRRVMEQLPKSRAAIHAAITLATPRSRRFRTLDWKAARAGQEEAKCFRFAKVDHDGARKLLDKALGDTRLAVETLGGVDFLYYAGHYSDWLEKEGDKADARKMGDACKKAADLRAARDKPGRERRQVA